VSVETASASILRVKTAVAYLYSVRGAGVQVLSHIPRKVRKTRSCHELLHCRLPFTEYGSGPISELRPLYDDTAFFPSLSHYPVA